VSVLCLDYVPYILNYTNDTKLQYVEDLLRPFIPPADGTLAKPKTGGQVNELHQAQIYIVTLQLLSLLTTSKLQIKVLVGRVLTDLKEVGSLVREAGAKQLDRMCTLEKKMDECLRRTLVHGRLLEDLIKEFNVSIALFYK
jgi:hypothetical protein